MRTTHMLPLFAALALAGCGGGTADDNGDGQISSGEAAEAAASVVKPQPGQYRTTYEMLEFDMPGIPDAVKQQMQAQMGGAAEVAQASTYCLTPEQASAQGQKDMVQGMAEGNCSFARFDVSGGTISADMRCTGADGATHHVVMDGEMTSTGSTMTQTTELDIGGQQVRMKARLTSERIGDCAG